MPCLQCLVTELVVEAEAVLCLGVLGGSLENQVPGGRVWAARALQHGVLLFQGLVEAEVTQAVFGQLGQRAQCHVGPKAAYERVVWHHCCSGRRACRGCLFCRGSLCGGSFLCRGVHCGCGSRGSWFHRSLSRNACRSYGRRALMVLSCRCYGSGDIGSCTSPGGISSYTTRFFRGVFDVGCGSFQLAGHRSDARANGGRVSVMATLGGRTISTTASSAVTV